MFPAFEERAITLSLVGISHDNTDSEESNAERKRLYCRRFSLLAFSTAGNPGDARAFYGTEGRHTRNVAIHSDTPRVYPDAENCRGDAVIAAEMPWNLSCIDPPPYPNRPALLFHEQDLFVSPKTSETLRREDAGEKTC